MAILPAIPAFEGHTPGITAVASGQWLPFGSFRSSAVREELRALPGRTAG